ncbi:MAG: DUF6508 domain-containing protein, partial [Fimbriimonadales bacterium]
CSSNISARLSIFAKTSDIPQIMAYNALMVEPPPPWPIEGIRETLAFLPVFEAEDFVAAVWEPPVTKVVDGREVTSMPYPHYSQEVDDFWATFSRTGGFINPYEPLPGDASSWIRFHEKPITLELLNTGTVDQLRRFLSLTKRGERFCDGHIESQLENGYIVEALRRIRSLIGDVV